MPDENKDDMNNHTGEGDLGIAEKIERSDESHKHPVEGKGYETRDVGPRLVFYSFAGLAVVTLICILLSRLLFVGFVAYHPNPEAEDRSPLADDRTLPPDPMLQAYPPADLDTYEHEQQDRLDHYGWVDRANGVVHIPIDEAIARVASGNVPPLVPANPASGGEAAPAGESDDEQ